MVHDLVNWHETDLTIEAGSVEGQRQAMKAVLLDTREKIFFRIIVEDE